ncbi:MAG TPA: hypothetical protein VFU31_30540 [Candidatus Binatia bacterium]|nr:hypothetical protein [Candidatus Binatia bacterium]
MKSRIYIWKRRCPAEAWAWLKAKVGVGDDCEIIMLLEGSTLVCELEERVRV